MFTDLEEGVRELFAQAQDLGSEPVMPGFHLDPKTAPRVHTKSAHRTEYMNAYAARNALEDIKNKLLAGERPKLGRRRGRPPSRWIEVASYLGIDLSDVKPPADSRPEWARNRDAKLRKRILAGERPRFDRRPPTAWLRVAAEMGVDLTPPAA